MKIHTVGNTFNSSLYTSTQGFTCNNNNNNYYYYYTRIMFTVLTSWLRVIVRVHLVHMMNAEQRQTAADLWTKPTDLTVGC